MRVREKAAAQRARNRRQLRARLHGQQRQVGKRPLPAPFPRAQRMQQRRQKRQQQAHRQGAARVQPQPQGDQREGRRGGQAAAQVVDHLIAVERRERAAAQKAQQLPIAPRPAFQPLEIPAQRAGESVVQRDVRGKAATGVQSLEQIVAQNRVVGQLALHGLHKGAHVHNALAAKDALAGNVLIGVGNAHGIAVHAALPGQQADEFAACRAQGKLHARLDEGIAPPLAVFLARPVHRMRDRADQPPRRVREHARVRVEREHIGIAPGELGRARAFGRKSVLPRQKQAIQIHQRAALALAPHPRAVRGVVRAFPVQKKIFLPPGPLVHRPNLRAHGGQDGFVLRQALPLSVAKIAQQQKADVFLLFHAAEHFQLPRQFLRARGRREQRGNGDQRGHLARNVFQFQL